MSKTKYTIIAAVVASLLCQVPTAEAAKAKARKVSTGESKQQTNKATSLLNTARKQVNKGKMQDAITTYWKVLELDSSEPYAYLELGELYKNLRIYDRSIEMLTSGLDLAKELDADTICNYYCILVEVYSITNQQGLANKALIKAAEASPRNPMPRKVLGDIYLKNNRIANAYKAYKKSLELDPYYQPAVDAMAYLKTEYGEKLPQEDKDSEYIKRVAVKLEDDKKDTESTVSTKPITTTESEATAANESVSETPESQETVSTQVETDEEQQEIAAETPKNNRQKLASKNDRPMPLKAEDMPKPKTKKKKAKQTKITDEDISIAESKAESNNQQEVEPETEEALAEAIDKNMDKFLQGNYTEKEEALTFFGKCGKPGLNAVEELLYDRNPEIRILAVRALVSFDQFPDDVRAILEDASDDSDEEVVEEIKKALSVL